MEHVLELLRYKLACPGAFWPPGEVAWEAHWTAQQSLRLLEQTPEV